MVDEGPQRSGELFDSGFCCGESVLLAVAEARGIRSELIPGIATGFCSGIARTCGLCGAVSGAIMAIGLSLGRSKPDQSVEETYDAVRELVHSFEARFGSANCLELTGADLGTEEGQNAYRASNQGQECTQYVEEATRMAIRLADGRS